MMTIERSWPWSHYESKPASSELLTELPKGILIRDVVGVKMPSGCKTIKEGYDILKAQGETFLDGQI